MGAQHKIVGIPVSVECQGSVIVGKQFVRVGLFQGLDFIEGGPLVAVSVVDLYLRKISFGCPEPNIKMLLIQRIGIGHRGLMIKCMQIHKYKYSFFLSVGCVMLTKKGP